MHRRRFLGAAGSLLPALLAGCTGPGGTNAASGAAEIPTARFEMDPVTDAGIARRVLPGIGVEDGPDERAALLDRIIDGGATTDGLSPPLRTGRHLFYDGAVYELSSEVVERTPATLYSVTVDIVEGEVDDAETVRFSDLPAVDRETFAENGLADGEVVGIGTTFLYTDAERARSALVPESNYSVIVWEDGARAEWVVDDADDTTLKTYRYAAETVAGAAEYGRRVRDAVGFALSDLSADQRGIVETAISEGYAVDPDATPSEPFAALVDRFRGQEQAHALDEEGEGDLSGPYVARYDGEVYWAVLVVDGTLRTTG